MKKIERSSEFARRDKLLTLLSEEELTRVSGAQAAMELTEGDEYVDLENLHRGVLRASGSGDVTPMGRVLPRKSVADATWQRIGHQLGNSSERASGPKTRP